VIEGEALADAVLLEKLEHLLFRLWAAVHKQKPDSEKTHVVLVPLIAEKRARTTLQ